MKDRSSPEKALADLIKGRRKSLGWTQEDLAEASGVGLRTIIRWERAEIRQPGTEQFQAVIDALGIDREAAYQALGLLRRGTQPEPASDARWDPAAGEPPEPLLDDNEIYLWNNPLEDWQMRWQLIIAYRVLKASKEARERERQPRRETG